MAWRVAALFSSRRDGATVDGATVEGSAGDRAAVGGATPGGAALLEAALDEAALVETAGSVGDELEVDTQLHYVHVCTLRNIGARAGSRQVQGNIHMDFTARA
jgi:hypothetical protein